MTDFILSQSGLLARVKGAQRLRDGSLLASIDFVSDTAVFTHRFNTTDAIQRGAVVDELARRMNLDADLVGGDLQWLESQLTDSEERRTEAHTSTASVEQWPEPLAAAAYHGPVGEILRAIDPVTEADPAAVLGHLLPAIGNVVGAGPHIRVQHDQHSARLFAVIVGETSKGRKGSSWSEPRHILELAAPDWTPRVRQGGLSSGEGLVYQVRDARYQSQPIKERGRVVDYQDVLVDSGVADKRLFVVEEEFASALSVMRREGNILSPIIRQAWDKGDLAPMVKNNPIAATGAHFGIVGHITREELRARLDDISLANGFGNRFLWLAARRSKLLPNGGGLTEQQATKYAVCLDRVFAFASLTSEIRRDAAAEDLWENIYGALSEAKPGMLGAALARSESQVLRLSLTYALLGESPLIRVEHLLAALAIWDYVEASARWIFGELFGDPVTDKLAKALKDAGDGGLDGTAIRDLFNRHESARIDQALATLQARGFLHLTREETGGRPRLVYTWRDKSDQSSAGKAS